MTNRSDDYIRSIAEQNIAIYLAMVEQNNSNESATAKNGIDYVRSIATQNIALFQEADAKTNLGTDAIIEISKSKNLNSIFAALHIRSGGSYFDKIKNLCTIPIANYFEYWNRHPLSVYGIVYVPELGEAYWIDIKKHLNSHPKDIRTIQFEKTLLNQLNKDKFSTLFVPYLLKEPQNISFDFAKQLFHSRLQEESALGIKILSSRFANQNETWNILVDLFLKMPLHMNNSNIIHALGKINVNQQLFEKSQDKCGAVLVRDFDVQKIKKLLYFVDIDNNWWEDDYGIEKSVYNIVLLINNFDNILKDILFDNHVENRFRKSAAFILALHFGQNIIPLLETVAPIDSHFFSTIIEHLSIFGRPYCYEMG